MVPAGPPDVAEIRKRASQAAALAV
jgi:hypothetical protein